MLPEKQDAFGQEIFDYYQGKGGKEIIEREDGLIDLSGGPEIYFSEYKNWPDFEKRSLKYCKGRILDIGCGAGRIALYLQKIGHDVLGIDNSPLAIKVCKRRGLKRAEVVSISDISTALGTFDSIVMFGNNFGLFGNIKRGQKLLNKLHDMTSGNARIIAASMDPYNTKNPDHLAYHKFNLKSGRMAGQVKIRVRYKKIKGIWFDYLLVSPKEMADIVKDTGWKLKKTIPDKHGAYVGIIEKVNQI